MPTSSKTAPLCPSCQTPLVRGRDRCVSCGMTRAKMVEFVKAQQAAARRGVTTLVDIPAADEPAGAGARRFVVPVAVALILLVLGAISYVGFTHFHSEAAAPWLAYPTDPKAVAKQYIDLASQDTVEDGEKAYKLLSLRVQRPDLNDDVGQYRQMYHVMDKYFESMFGPDWALHAKYEDASTSSAAQPVIAVHIETDVLHVVLTPQGPEKGPMPSPPHYGVVEIKEFPIEDAGKAQQMGAITGILGGLGAEGSVRDLRSISGVLGRHGREKPFETKIRLMPILQDPRAPGLHRALVQIWPVRHDPTVRNFLKKMTEDQRYDPSDRRTAQDVLDDKIDPAELIGNGVPDSE